VVAAGVVVVAAAGNYGRDPQGRTHYGGITAPGNAPWVLTVGASSHMGTIDRADDTIALFSSRGPSAVNYGAKPDVVAPGVGTESLSDPNSSLYSSRSAYLLSGTVPTSYLPYLSLSGTSMAAPVVTGAVALMLQANPALTPNQIKAILQYTAQVYPGYDRLTQGVGFLNAKGAVELARFFAGPSTAAYPTSADWSAQLIWGNRLFQGGRLTTAANAWPTNVTWGDSNTSSGQTVEWGVICPTANCYTGGGTWIPWGTTASAQNIVWGTRCGGADCDPSSPGAFTTVAGASDGDGVVWGTSAGDGVVWGTTDGDGVVWGTSCTDPSCQPVIWR
jgi:serine protease AprX